MRVSVISDLHLEFADLTLPGGDVLILSGDVLEAKNLNRDRYDPEYVTLPHERADRRADRYYRFLEEECSQKYREIIYVMGNHEHYHFKYHQTFEKLIANLPDNVHLLEDQTHDIDGVTFVGCTLWTDCNREDGMTMWNLKQNMSDYRLITMFDEAKSLYHKLTPQRTVADHYRSRQYIDTVTQDTSKQYVVVTHHAPSRASTHEYYRRDHLMNGGYSSGLDEFIMDRPQIKFWTHGHTHDPFDYMIGSTRVICNPRGYKGHEHQADIFDPTVGFDI
jgi:predicted phosphodiesterase